MSQTETNNVVKPPTARAADRRAYGRAKVSNGHEYFPGITDGRSITARRMRDIALSIKENQGDMTEARWQHVRRFSGVAALAERVEARIANGENIDNADISAYALLCSTQVRLGSKIDVDRVPKDITNVSLDEYLTQHSDEAAPYGAAARKTDEAVDD